MEPITIISVVSAILGASKALIDIYSSSNSLFKKKDYSIFDEMSLDKSSKETLKVVYNSLSIGKEVMNRIIRKLVINYVFVTLLFIVILVSFLKYVSFLQNIKVLFYFLIPIGIYLFLTFFLPNPIKTRLEISKQRVLESFDWEIYKKGINRFKIKNVLLYAFLTHTEVKFMYRYLRLYRLKDSIETHILANSILDSKKSLENEFKNHKKWIIREEMIALIKDNKLISKKEKKKFNEKRLDKLGVDILLADKAEKFYGENLSQAYHENGDIGLIRIIDRYW